MLIDSLTQAAGLTLPDHKRTGGTFMENKAKIITVAGKGGVEIGRAHV